MYHDRRKQEIEYYQAKASFTKAFSRSLATHSEKSRKAEVSQVLPNLLLAGKDAEADRELLQIRGVTHILQVGMELSPSHPNSFYYKTLPLFDLEEQDLVSYLPECFDFINEGIRAGGGVLVHCVAGVSRSASVVVAYIMATQGRTFIDARAVVKAARPIVNLNLGFVLQLKYFESQGASVFKQESWVPWSLKRFIEAKESAAAKGEVPDDRTVMGACKTAEAALLLDCLEDNESSLNSLVENQQQEDQQQQQQQQPTKQYPNLLDNSPLPELFSTCIMNAADVTGGSNLSLQPYGTTAGPAWFSHQRAEDQHLQIPETSFEKTAETILEHQMPYLAINAPMLSPAQQNQQQLAQATEYQYNQQQPVHVRRQGSSRPQSRLAASGSGDWTTCDPGPKLVRSRSELRRCSPQMIGIQGQRSHLRNSLRNTSTSHGDVSTDPSLHDDNQLMTFKSPVESGDLDERQKAWWASAFAHGDSDSYLDAENNSSEPIVSNQSGYPHNSNSSQAPASPKEPWTPKPSMSLTGGLSPAILPLSPPTTPPGMGSIREPCFLPPLNQYQPLGASYLPSSPKAPPLRRHLMYKYAQALQEAASGSRSIPSLNDEGGDKGVISDGLTAGGRQGVVADDISGVVNAWTELPGQPKLTLPVGDMASQGEEAWCLSSPRSHISSRSPSFTLPSLKGSRPGTAQSILSEMSFGSSHSEPVFSCSNSMCASPPPRSGSSSISGAVWAGRASSLGLALDEPLLPGRHGHRSAMNKVPVMPLILPRITSGRNGASGGGQPSGQAEVTPPGAAKQGQRLSVGQSGKHQQSAELPLVPEVPCTVGI